MKKFFIFVIIITAAVTPAAETDVSLWYIVRHSFEIEEAEQAINKMAKKSYLPSGLHVTEGEAITVLYVYSEKQIFNKWLLQYFEDLNTIDAECSQLINQGWVPMGLSKARKGLFMIFANLDLVVSEWKIAVSQQDNDSIIKTTRDNFTEGFTCYGIAGDTEDRFWYLFLKTPKSAENRNEIVVLPNNPQTIKNRLDEFMAKSWLPWGITQNQGKYNILLFK